MQERVFGYSIDPASYLYFWSAVAALGLLVVGSEIYWRNQRETSEARSLARDLTSRFGIHLGAAAVLSYTLLRIAPSALGILPTLWALIFGLGLVAIEPLLNRRVRIASAFYILFALLNFATFGLQLNLWTMPLAFGIGQALVAWALWQDGTKDKAGGQIK